jgi:uncharacterized protein (TIGR03118 family)
MKNPIKTSALLAVLIVISCFYSCKKDHNNERRVEVDKVNLVSDTAGYGASRIDTNLSNAWGIAAATAGPLWISSNHKGVSVVYDRTGQALRAPVTVPSVAAGQMGAPTGVIFNSTSDFGGNKFIFAGEDGTVAGWSSGNSAVIVADRSSSNAVYKGIAMANDGTANFIYLANFKGGKVDVFDKNFNYVTNKPFIDPNIPAGFAPFNIANIGGKLYVAYAKLKAPDNMDDQSGPGNGYVDIFTPDGVLVKRFASQGNLNSPWGIALAPAGFGDEKQTTILVGNFGDGRINIFDMQGHFESQLESGGQVLVIDGLWDIDFLKNNMPGGNSTDPLFFTAGPDEEAHSLFGYVQKK